MEESLDAAFTLKQRIRPLLQNIPYIEEYVPVVCAWYPTAHAVLLWNLSEETKPMTLVYKNERRRVSVPGLGTELIEGLM